MKEQNIDQLFPSLIDAAQSFGVTINESVVHRCIEFGKLLIEGNKETNLTRMTSAESLMTGMFLDSLLFLKHIDFSKDREILDIGTGAGFPAVVLAIAAKEELQKQQSANVIKITAIDCRHRKTDFISEAVKTMEMEDIEAIHTRIEDFESHKFDYVVARAVGSLNKTIKLGIPHLKSNGRMIVACSEKAYSASLGKKLKVVMKSFPYRLPEYNNNFTHVIVRKKR